MSLDSRLNRREGIRRPKALRRAVGTSALVGFVVAAQAGSLEPTIDVVPLGCSGGVHLVAERAPASEVLARLGRTAGFRVAGSDRLSSLVTIDSVQPTRRLLDTILRDENSIVKEEPDPRCPGRSRVTMVWIIEKTTAGATTTVQRAAVAKEPYVTPESKANDDLYRQGHGMAP